MHPKFSKLAGPDQHDGQWVDYLSSNMPAIVLIIKPINSDLKKPYEEGVISPAEAIRTSAGNIQGAEPVLEPSVSICIVSTPSRRPSPAPGTQTIVNLLHILELHLQYQLWSEFEFAHHDMYSRKDD